MHSRNAQHMVFPDMGSINGDAGIRSMPNKINSDGGHVLLLTKKKKEVACVLMWRSKKLVRKVVSLSSLAGEALACVVNIGELVYIKSVLLQIYGDAIKMIPTIVFTDSRNLFNAFYSSFSRRCLARHCHHKGSIRKRNNYVG